MLSIRCAASSSARQLHARRAIATRRPGLVATIRLFAAAAAPAAFGQVRFEIVDLGTVAPFRAWNAFAVNENIVVTGDAVNSAFRTHAYRWEAGSILDLGTLAPSEAGDSIGNDINNLGRIVGTSDLDNTFSTDRAFYYDGANMINLGTLGGSDSYAFGINESNQVVGWSWRDNTINNPGVFIWSPGTGMVDIMSGFGRDINEEGDICGYRRNPSNNQAFIRDGSTIINLGFLPNGVVSEAFALNDKEVVVGWSSYINGNLSDRMAFVWRNGVMSSLGTLPDSGFIDYVGSIALDINNAGTIVGNAQYDTGGPINGNTPAIWFNGWTLRLSNLVTNLGSWELRSANGINHQGFIVGEGFQNSQIKGFLLRPVFPDGAILVPNSVEDVVYVIDPETGMPFSTFATPFARDGVEVIDGNGDDLLMSDSGLGVIWTMHPDGTFEDQFNNIPVNNIRGIAKSLAGYIVGATSGGFAAWQSNGVGGIEPAYTDDLWDVVFSNLGSKFYLTTNTTDDNVQGHNLQLNFTGQTPVNQALDPRQTAIIDNQIYVCSYGNSRIYRYRLTNGALISSFQVTTGLPIGVIELKNDNLLVSTTRGLYEYRKTGALVREVYQGQGFQYLSWVQNYNP